MPKTIPILFFLNLTIFIVFSTIGLHIYKGYAKNKTMTVNNALKAIFFISLRSVFLAASELIPNVRVAQLAYNLSHLATIIALLYAVSYQYSLNYSRNVPAAWVKAGKVFALGLLLFSVFRLEPGRIQQAGRFSFYDPARIGIFVFYRLALIFISPLMGWLMISKSLKIQDPKLRRKSLLFSLFGVFIALAVAIGVIVGIKTKMGFFWGRLVALSIFNIAAIILAVSIFLKIDTDQVK